MDPIFPNGRIRIRFFFQRVESGSDFLRRVGSGSDFSKGSDLVNYIVYVNWIWIQVFMEGTDMDPIFPNGRIRIRFFFPTG